MCIYKKYDLLELFYPQKCTGKIYAINWRTEYPYNYMDILASHKHTDQKKQEQKMSDEGKLAVSHSRTSCDRCFRLSDYKIWHMCDIVQNITSAEKS